jgi:hypothetical protein
MTPERIKELRKMVVDFAGFNVQWHIQVTECLDYIDTLQRDVATYAKRDELIVGRMMMERDLAREENAKLQAELAALQNECCSCEVCGTEIESQVCRDCAIEEHEKYAKELEQTIKDRDAELSALKTPPKCPKCGSDCINVESITEHQHYTYCQLCEDTQGKIMDTIDSALNAWRKV